jgi:hypothetical protein
VTLAYHKKIACPGQAHHQQIGVKLLAIIGFTPYYWQLLAIIAIIGYYWLLFFLQKFSYYWLLL